MEKKIAVVGYGSDIRSDDAVGIHVARYIEEHVPGVMVRTGMNAVDLVMLFPEVDKVILVDAAFMDEEPGTHVRVPFDTVNLPNDSSFSHDMNFRELLPLARQMEVPIPEIIFYLIRPKNLEFGDTMTDEMHAGMDGLISSLMEELRQDL